MIKYCKSCGKEYKGDWCEHCGYGKPDQEIKAFDKYKVEKPERFMTEEELEERSKKLAEEKEQAEQSEKAVSAKRRQAQKSSSQWGYIILGAVALAAVILFALYSNGIIFKGSDKADTIVNYFTAVAEGDFEKYISTMVEPMADDYREELKKLQLSEDEFMRKSYADYAELFGEDFKAENITVGKETAMSSAEIKESEKTLKAAYGKSFDIKEAYKVGVEVEYKGSQADMTMNYYVYVGKIKGDWYILNIEG